MKTLNSYISTTIFLLLIISQANCQLPGINDSIAKYRKGELTIKAKPGSQVTVEQLSHEFWFGAAITNGIAGNGRMSENDIKTFKEKFLENFNSAVTENAVKWLDMERTRGEVNYNVIDGILQFTEENNIPLRAHNLFWGIPQFVQPWVKELSEAELRETMKKRAETITSKYKGRFAEYDLNNEMIHGNYYEDRLGPGITKEMAEWAHAGDPDAKLYLNDYDILTGKKLPEYMAHIRLLLRQGVPVAGIGVQGHLHTETFDRMELRRSLDSLAKFNLPIKVTEFNMPGQRSGFHRKKILKMTPEEEEFNAKELVDYYRICFAHPSVEAILMWGFWEGANWIPVSSLYRRDWSPLPAAAAYKNLIFNEWWTKESGKTDNKGEFSIPAYYGRYRVTITYYGKDRVTVNKVSKEINLTKKEGKVIVTL
jgi:endo-1,4-beta-xylanase